MSSRPTPVPPDARANPATPATGVVADGVWRRDPITALLLGAIVVLAAALRLLALERQLLWWDEGNNAYFAHASLAELLRLSRATMDTDPPVHRMALRAWLWLWGDGVWQLRSLSAVCGILGVALSYEWGRWLYGRRVGLVAAALTAVWPMYVFYSREGKGYAWMALFAGLSVYLWQRYLDQAPRWRLLPWLGATLSAALALGAHYYVALGMAAQGLGLVVVLLIERASWRESWRRLGRWLTVQLGAVVLVAPWVIVTYRTAWPGATSLPEVGAQESLLAYGRKVLATLAAMPDASWPLALAAALLLGVFMLLALFDRRRETRALFLTLLSLLPLALGFAAQQAVAFLHPRFLLYILPPLAILAAAGLVRLGKWGLALGAGLALVWGLALPSAFGPLDASQEDLDPVAQALGEHARPGDGLVVGYIWQEGILELLAPELPLDYYLGWFQDETVEGELLTLLQKHERLWLLTYDTALQHPDNTGGWWLEQNTARAFLLEAPPYVLTLYTDPQLETASQTVCVSTAQTGPQAIFDGHVALLAATVPEAAVAGETLSLSLSWTVTDDAPPEVEPWVVFVHLMDASGQLVAQSDGWPMNGLASFGEADCEKVIAGERALLIPREAAPGPYEVWVGLYDGETGARQTVLSGPEPGDDHVVIGKVQVTAPPPILDQ